VKTLLVTGGGSGGHVTPALAVMSQMHAAGWRVVYVGSTSGLEEALVTPLTDTTGVRYYGIASGKLRRYFSWRNVSDAFFVLVGCVQALWRVGRERPSVVFSKGGFVAFPVVLAAWLWRVPVVAHESDATQGLANKLSAPFVRTLCTSFPETPVENFKGRVVYTGAPIRGELLQGDSQRGRARVGAGEAQRVLLVTGGSLGAEALNAVVVAALEGLTRHHNWFVVHVCGPGKVAPLPASALQPDSYRAFEFVGDGWADLLAAADVVVTRAGANTLFELLSLGKPNLLIPLPKQGSRGDQLDNAAYAANNGFSKVLLEEQLTPAKLVDAVNAMAADLDRWHEGLAKFSQANGALQIAAEIQRLAP